MSSFLSLRMMNVFTQGRYWTSVSDEPSTYTHSSLMLLSLCQIVMSNCHYVKLSYQIVIMSNCHVKLSCQIVITSNCHIKLSLCQIVITSIFYYLNFYFVPYNTVIFRTYYAILIWNLAPVAQTCYHFFACLEFMVN